MLRRCVCVMTLLTAIKHGLMFQTSNLGWSATRERTTHYQTVVCAMFRVWLSQNSKSSPQCSLFGRAGEKPCFSRVSLTCIYASNIEAGDSIYLSAKSKGQEWQAGNTVWHYCSWFVGGWGRCGYPHSQAATRMDALNKGMGGTQNRRSALTRFVDGCQIQQARCERVVGSSAIPITTIQSTCAG